MSDYAMTQNNGDGGRDVEMSDVRLLDEDEMDDTLPFGQSNLTSVLANPDFARRRCCSTYARMISCVAVLSLYILYLFYRPWDQFLRYLQERPHPMFNFPTAGTPCYFDICQFAVQHSAVRWCCSIAAVAQVLRLTYAILSLVLISQRQPVHMQVLLC